MQIFDGEDNFQNFGRSPFRPLSDIDESISDSQNGEKDSEWNSHDSGLIENDGTAVNILDLSDLKLDKIGSTHRPLDSPMGKNRFGDKSPYKVARMTGTPSNRRKAFPAKSSLSKKSKFLSNFKFRNFKKTSTYTGSDMFKDFDKLKYKKNKRKDEN